jgi:hypothetical protein
VSVFIIHEYIIYYGLTTYHIFFSISMPHGLFTLQVAQMIMLMMRRRRF